MGETFEIHRGSLLLSFLRCLLPVLLFCQNLHVLRSIGTAFAERGDVIDLSPRRGLRKPFVSQEFILGSLAAVHLWKS